jgi:sugar transferase (PEP-CTERM system associated)
MFRIFRHYVPKRLIGLVAAESVIVAASVYAGRLLPALGLPEIVPTWNIRPPAAFVLTLLALQMLHMAGLYDSRERYGRPELLLRVFLALGGAYLGSAMLGFFVHMVALGRLALVLSFGVSLTAIYTLRLAEERFLEEHRHRRKILLVGGGRVSRLLAETIEHARTHYEIIGCVNGLPEGNGDDAGGMRILGSVTDLGLVTKITRPDLVVVAMEERRGALPLPAILDCKLQGIEVEDWPTFYERLTGRIPITRLRPSWLVFSVGFTRRRGTLILKRAIDLVLSSLGCLLSLPVMPLIALAIKLDSAGPVFFRQERMGQNGRVFALIKFRSMRSAVAVRSDGPTVGADPRITRVGALLRKTRLDELPQLFNVLRGDMSVVGPRPEWVALVPEFQDKVPFYLHRLAVKPGITGWAQVRNGYGSSVENTVEKLQYDLYYIKNHSLFLDALILLHTMQAVIFGRGR